jgi:hypothetical protein
MASALLLVVFIMPAEAWVQVSYSLDDLGSGRWKATYHINNADSSTDVSWLTVFFDYGLFDNLAVETPSPLSEQWDQTVWNPYRIDLFPVPGLYDLRAKSSGLLPGQSLSGLAVSFDWFGQGNPTIEQRVEIYADPGTLQQVWVGTAVYIPEPATLLGLSLGAGWIFIQRKNSR